MSWWACRTTNHFDKLRVTLCNLNKLWRIRSWKRAPSYVVATGTMVPTPACSHWIWTMLRRTRTRTLVFAAPGTMKRRFHGLKIKITQIKRICVIYENSRNLCVSWPDFRNLRIFKPSQNTTDLMPVVYKKRRTQKISICISSFCENSVWITRFNEHWFSLRPVVCRNSVFGYLESGFKFISNSCFRI